MSAEFQAGEWRYIRDRGWICHTRLDRERDEAGLAELVGSVVAIDGDGYVCRGVERFTHSSPWREGEAIGLLIEGDPMDPNSNRGYSLPAAENLAALWRAGKLIGGNAEEVSAILLTEIERLRDVIDELRLP